MSFDQCHIIHWRKLGKLKEKCVLKLHVFFIRKIYVRKGASKIPKPEKNFKPQTSNARAKIFENADFS